MSNTTFDLEKLSVKALHGLPEAVLWMDENGKFFEVNPLGCQIWGYTREEFLKLHVFDINPNFTPDIWPAHWAAQVQDGSTFESTHRRKDGTVFPVDITNNFVEFEGKKVSCSIVRDISDRKKANRIARLSDFTIQNMADAIFWICPKGFIKHVNATACQRYGYTKADLEKMNILQLSKNMKREELDNIFARLRKDQQLLLEGIHFTKDDEAIDVEISANYVSFENMEYTCSIVRDIRERKRKEAALRGALMEIRSLKEKLEAENHYLQEEIEVQNNFGEIVSNSPKFRKVLTKIEQVADTSSTVLITGESGTGKELIARAVHQLSRRNNRPMIKVNCAALPANLIESELFGHEKGAFTGAINRRIGKFELADKGTLFLDEIGELPIELQSKLLRAIQEGEIERLGSTTALKIDVRLIAATNRDLPKEIEKGNFREDLYYRLNVFPIHSIPLRKRREDIPLLTQYFCDKVGSKLGRKIEIIPQKVIDQLVEYDFPGNVRELENLVERAIITSKRGKLQLGDWFNPKHKIKKPVDFLSMEDMQKKYIIDVLKHTNWRVSGDQGAAKILGMRPTTLYSKMDKLNIKRSMDVAKDGDE